MSLIRQFAIRNELLYSGFELPNVKIVFVQKISFATFGVSIDDFFFTRYAGLGYSLCRYYSEFLHTMRHFLIILPMNKGWLLYLNCEMSACVLCFFLVVPWSGLQRDFDISYKNYLLKDKGTDKKNEFVVSVH